MCIKRLRVLWDAVLTPWQGGFDGSKGAWRDTGADCHPGSVDGYRFSKRRRHIHIGNWQDGRRCAGVGRAVRNLEKRQEPMTETKRDYEVGYGKLPVGKRFTSYLSRLRQLNLTTLAALSSPVWYSQIVAGQS